MNTNFSEIFVRATVLNASGSNIEQAAKKMNAEFHASVYVNNGKMWASFKDHAGTQTTRVVM